MDVELAAKYLKNLVLRLNGLLIHCNKLGIAHAAHILDDCFLIKNSKQSALSKLIDVCADIGIPLAADKTVMPTQIFEFVRITIHVTQKQT